MAIAIDVLNLGEFAQDSAGATVACTTTSAAAAGSTIILTGTLITNPETVNSAADNGPGLTWTIDNQWFGSVNGDASTFMASAYAPAGMASGTTITVTFSASTAGGRSVTATSFTGIASASPVDVASLRSLGAATTAWTTPSMSVLAGSVIVGISGTFTGQLTSLVTGPSIEAHDLGDAGGFAQTTCYQIVAAGGSATVAGTWSSNATSTTGGVAYKAGAAVSALRSTQWLGAIG